MEFEFDVTLLGEGKDQAEAWMNAVEAFGSDPGEPSVVRVLQEGKSPDVGDLQDLVSKAMRQCWNLGQQYWRECEAELHEAICQPENTQQQYFQLVDEVRAQIAKELGDGT